MSWRRPGSVAIIARMPIHTIRRLDLRARPGTLPWDESHAYATVDLVLDGRNLVDWLAPIEIAERGEAVSGRATEYLGHPVSADLRGLLRGTWSGDPFEDFDGRVALLGCTCTVIGCGPLCARIDAGPDWVTWTDLVRYRGYGGFDYGDIAFRFPAAAYAASLDRWEREHPPSTPA